MAGPDTVSTPEQLAQALNEMILNSGKTMERVASAAGLAPNTVRAAARGTSFPQEGTLHELVRICGGDKAAWTRAWHRANNARPKAERGAAADDPLVEALNRVALLEEKLEDALRRVAELDKKVQVLSTAFHAMRDMDARIRAAKNEAEADRRRRQREGRELLNSVPVRFVYGHPDFNRNYYVEAVDRYVAEVKKLAMADMEQLKTFLLTTPSDFPRIGRMGYNPTEVDDYIARLKAAVFNP
ncbi:MULTISPECIES: hypothetical protein [unclassified Streptomyces]|uniref:hypothetical protein n=1 Tax=unclassified Streptomyces TaxID=2593676 RepID=UPI003438FE39